MHWSGFEALKGLKHHAITVKRNKCNNRMFERQLQKEKEQTENIKGNDSDIKAHHINKGLQLPLQELLTRIFSVLVEKLILKRILQ